MHSIEEFVLSNYKRNMEYFQSNHPALHNKLSAMEIVLEDGRYTQKYELEYKDGYFDILELASGSCLYNENSAIYSQKLVDQINFRKDAQVFKTAYDLTFTQEAMQKVKGADALTMYATTAPIIDYHNKNTAPSMRMNTLDKFIFIGLGLALHFDHIVKKIKAQSILIIEDDLELFRLSMFTCDYAASLLGCIAYFGVAQTKDEFQETFTSFYLNIFVHNLYLKFSLFSTQYTYKIKELQGLIVSRPETTYSHEFLLKKNEKVLGKLTTDYKFLNISKKDNETFFNDKPILVLGAGPSLHANIQWLKKNQNDFIILCVFSALKTLQKNDVFPDIVMQLDEKVTPTVLLTQSFENFDFLKNSAFIFSASVPDILFETFSKNNLYLLEDRTTYKQFNESIRAYSVGEIAYSTALSLNANKIYLLGLDLALADDGSTHSKEHHLANKLDTSNVNKVQESASVMDSTLYVKGNFKEQVVTTTVFSLSINLINHYTKELKSANQFVYNLNDGAYFDSVIPLRTFDYVKGKQIDKKALQFDLNELLTSYSSSILSDNEVSSLCDKMKQVNTYQEFLSVFSSIATSNKDLFLGAYQNLVIAMVNNSDTELREIMRIYFFKTSPYVTDLFISKEINSYKKHTKKMKKIIIEQVEKILNFYENELKNAIEKSDSKVYFHAKA